jgi:formylglycine-generating enzyme required for sulfatase activity
MQVLKKFGLLCMAALSLATVVGLYSTGHAANRGFGVVPIKAADGKQVGLYKGSHALIIGVSDYTAGWPDLESIPGEMKKLETALKGKGFSVTKIINPDSRGLKRGFEDFIEKYGYDTNNRLLFFYAGHGYTRDNNNKGYLVPTDAPSPERNERGFLRKAVRMSKVMAWARDIEAKHALFLFDSCFSGTVFKARDLPKAPPAIREMTTRPVRQFITAGSAGETVPAKSTFTPAFIDAITHGEGDLNKDGYVSGMELGLHLQQEVPLHTRQTPQFGKITDYELSRGDFIFLAGGLPDTGSVTDVNVQGGRAGSSASQETVFWQSIQGMNDPDAYKAYLRKYPNGLFADVARLKIKKLSKPKAHPLTITTIPRNAKIRILNIGPRYRAGMLLKPGSYHIEVSASGYKKQRRWVELIPGGLTVPVSLKKVVVIPFKAQVPSAGTERSFDGIKFVWVPGGSFKMGSNSGGGDEKPVHQVKLSGFWLGKYEVTQGQWRKIMGNNPSSFSSCGSDCPVEKVSWKDSQQFIGKLNRRGGGKYRLPSEAQWEYACRSGGRSEKYAGGSDAGSVAWYLDNSGRKTHRAGTKNANGLGLHDMSGNVWEWVRDIYAKDAYSSHTHRNPIYESSGSIRVLRGGSWGYVARDTRCARRDFDVPGFRYSRLGLRLARKP